MAQVDVRVVVVGRAYSGKTCLVQRLVQQRFVGEQSLSTLGVALTLTEITVDANTLTLGIWDTAGDEQYADVARICSKRMDAAIICFDSIPSLEHILNLWINHFREQKNCRIYLCSTKQDLNDELHLDPQILNLAKNFELEAPWATSSMTGFNVNELFQKIGFDFALNHVLNYQSLNQRSSMIERPLCQRIANALCCCKKGY